MRNSEWVLNAYCRSCGIGSTVRVDDDQRLVRPAVIHEADCDLAQPDDRKESAPARRPTGPIGTARRRRV